MSKATVSKATVSKATVSKATVSKCLVVLSLCVISDLPGNVCWGQSGSGPAVVSPPHPKSRKQTRLERTVWKVPELQPGAKSRGIVVHARSHGERVLKVEEALLEVTSLDVSAMPLDSVANLISESRKIPVRLDEKALQEAGVNKDVEVSMTVKDVRLSSALALLLRDVGGQALTTYIDETGLVITTEEQASRQRETRVYDVKVLQFPQLGALSDIIQDTVPGPWQETYGEGGTISPWEGAIVVRHSQAVHREVQQLLESMLDHLTTVPEKGPPQILVHWHPQTSKTRLIEKMLFRPTKLEFQSIPLENVMDMLQKQQNLPICLDEKSLQEAGVPKDAEVSLTTGGEVKLQVALTKLLNDVGGQALTTIIQHEHLVVTTSERAYQLFETRVYDVRGLQAENPQQLVDLLEESVPGPWSETDGEGGTVRPWAGSLIVRQTQKVHVETRALLEQLLALRTEK